jgi:nitrogenase molybdenum-iron protein alpha/beta subunit
MIEKAIARITEQQQGLSEEDNVFGVGEQLKDICRESAEIAELVFQDLENPEMSISKAEEKIHAKADELHKKHKGKSVCVTPHIADKILRDFYGLPPKGEAPATSSAPKLIDINDFI